MRTNLPPRSPDRGAILIHVAVGLLVLLAFSAFAIDVGVMWVSRNQAQNTADAAALAAATTLAFDEGANQADAKKAAIAVGAVNPIWGRSPDILPADITFPPCPPGAPGPPDMCVKVDVFRNGTHGSVALPTFFARLIRVNSQGVRATATAQVLITNRSDCVKPWAVPDKWTEISDSLGRPDGPWTTNSTYDLHYGSGPNKGLPLPYPDQYIPPFNPDGSANANTTGFKIEGDPNNKGLQLTIKPKTPQDSISPGWFFPVDLPRPNGLPTTGGNVYEWNIENCNGMVIKPGDSLVNEPGDMVGPTKAGVQALIDLDPNAAWNGTKVINSDYGDNGSPRLVALPVFNVDTYMRGRASGRTDIVISNVLGFFIEDLTASGDVVGVLTHKPVLSGTINTNQEASFLRTVILVR